MLAASKNLAESKILAARENQADDRIIAGVEIPPLGEKPAFEEKLAESEKHKIPNSAFKRPITEPKKRT